MEVEDWKTKMVNAMLSSDADMALQMKKNHIPKKIYKYCSLSLLTLSTLEKESLWFSSPFSFNDPFDSALDVLFKLHLDGVDWDDFVEKVQLNTIFNEIELAEIKEKPVSPGALLQLAQSRYPDSNGQAKTGLFIASIRDALLRDDLNNTIKDLLRVCCLSEVNNSILMWSHYARNHTGICIEFDTGTFVRHNFVRDHVFPVIYSDDIFDGSQYLDSFKLPKLIGYIASIHKHEAWSYEKEWRLIMENGALEKDGYLKMPLPSAIYLGAKVSNDESELVVQLAKRKNIKLFKMNLHPKRFQLLPTVY